MLHRHEAVAPGLGGGALGEVGAPARGADLALGAQPVERVEDGGDADAALERVGLPVAALTSEQWLVMHAEDRHQPPVRTLVERLVRLLGAHRALFRGAAAGQADQGGLSPPP